MVVVGGWMGGRSGMIFPDDCLRKVRTLGPWRRKRKGEEEKKDKGLRGVGVRGRGISNSLN